MAEPRWLRALSFVAILLYPALIYFGLKRFDPRWLALCLVVVAARYAMGTQLSSTLRATWGVCILLLALATLLTDSALGLLLYPVLMNGLMFLLFFSSWLHPPTVIERMARLREPDLTEAAVQYTRNLTLLWCAFFIVNGGIALFTLTQDQEWWLLYNGLISYVLIGALFLGERVFRKWILAR